MDDPFAPPEAEVEPAGPPARERSRVWLVLSTLWLAVGGVACLPWLGIGFDREPLVWVSFWPLFLPALPFYVLHSVIPLPFLGEGVFWATGHSPPFLTPLGLAVVYGLPALIAWPLHFVRRRSKAAHG